MTTLTDFSPATRSLGFWSAVLATIFSLCYDLAQLAEWFGWFGSAGGAGAQRLAVQLGWNRRKMRTLPRPPARGSTLTV
jgi:hypothetical protein